MADRVRAIHRVLGVGSPAVVLLHPDGTIEVRGVDEPDPSAVDAALLDLTKEERKRDVEQEKRARTTRPFMVPVSGGPPVNLDPSDRERIDDIYGAAIEAQDDPTGTFVILDRNDQERALNARQVIFLATRLRRRLSAYNRRQAALNREIDAQTDPGNIPAIDIDVGWPD